MDKQDVTRMIRQRMDAGILPRIIAPLTTEPGWPTSPTGHITADSAIGVATFETEPRTTEQIAALLADKGERYPTVVVERAGRVIAWAGAGAYRSRPAYAGVAEHSVYVARVARGTGAGRAALSALCAAYAARGFWKLVSRIF